MDRLAAMTAFIRVADAGSFSAAARQLGIGQPAVSKQIAQLEAHLGARLVVRTTHGLSLTLDGRKFLDSARTAIEAADAAEASVSGRDAAPSGRLRVAASVAFARLHIVPRLRRFNSLYPEVEIELVLSDRFVDLVEEGVDVAIRIGELKGSGLVARRVGQMARVTVARPDYWDAHSVPTHPEDLKRHHCIVFTGLASSDVWEYAGPEGKIAVKVAGWLRVSTSDAMREAVLEGLGVGLTPHWFWRNELGAGVLESVLAAFEPPSGPIQAIFPERRLVSSKVRVFVEFLAEEFRREPALSAPAR